MKQLIQYLKKYWIRYADRKAYWLTGLFLSISIVLNYIFDFEDVYLDQFNGTTVGFLFYFLFQAFPYLIICLILKWCYPKLDFWKNKDFWTTIVFGFGVYAVYRNLNLYAEIVNWVSPELTYYTYKTIGRLIRLIILIILFYLFYRLVDQQPHFYGLTSKNVKLKPYFLLLLMVIPLIITASFSPDFMRQYPLSKRSGAQAANFFLSLPISTLTGFFELIYALSFFAVELFFRGFLIFSMTRFLGGHVVLPMVASYAFLHFGKPIGETISSIFGGYLLGVIAYYSHNIWGGIIVHIGLALLMELAAWIQMSV